MKESIYYVGFNANNAIKNEDFFAGSFTLYPTKEKGNINFLTDVPKYNDEELFSRYQEFCNNKIDELLYQNPNTKIMCFNKKAKKLCVKFKDNFTQSNDDKLVDTLNNKFEIRELLKDVVPILDYFWVDDLTSTYEEIVEKLNANTFVVQGVTGAGGNTTYFVNNSEEYNEIPNRIGKFCVSAYIKNTPLNVTAIVCDDKNIVFPLSAQLILSNNRNFMYVGGDFIYAKSLSNEVLNQAKTYTENILNKVKSMGYRGIIGIDYILTDQNKVLFMEINPRFQASSFLINMELKKLNLPCLAELNYKALNGIKIEENFSSVNINYAFLNCNQNTTFSQFENIDIVWEGYYEKNPTSVYRKIYNYSVLNNDIFEHI